MLYLKLLLIVWLTVLSSACQISRTSQSDSRTAENRLMFHREVLVGDFLVVLREEVVREPCGLGQALPLKTNSSVEIRF